MKPGMLPAVVLVCVVLLLFAPAWWSLRSRRRQARLAEEYQDAYRALRERSDARSEPARFSYRPCTGELRLDLRAARLHGLLDTWQEPEGFVTIDGWHGLPDTAGLAGWIDETLAEGLATRQPVECEYLARAAGRADRHLRMTAVPLRTADVLVGAVFVSHPGRPPARPHEDRTRGMGRAWLPGPAAAAPPSAAP